MDSKSDFQKELELDVVPEEDAADELIRELQLKGKLPTTMKEILKKPKLAYGEDRAVERVDTLREEEVCPFGLGNNDCGLDNGSCAVCGYEEEPEGFEDPDLTKAREWDEQEKEKKERLQAMKERRQQKKKHESPSKMNRPGRPSFASKTSSRDQLAFLYELSGSVPEMIEHYIQQEIDAGRADQDLMDAYMILETQGLESFRNHVFKADPATADMVDSLYLDDPDEEPDWDARTRHRNDADALRQQQMKRLPRRGPTRDNPRGPAEPGNWDYLLGR